MSEHGPGAEDYYYGVGGDLHKALEREVGQKINFVSFCAIHLQGEEQDRFVRECVDAQVVVTDWWTHPYGKESRNQEWLDAEQTMAIVVRRVFEVSSTVIVFSLLKRWTTRAAVHDQTPAKPLKSLYHRDELIQAIRESAAHRE